MWGTFTPISFFYAFLFSSEEPARTAEINRQTDAWAIPVLRPIKVGGVHEKKLKFFFQQHSKHSGPVYVKKRLRSHYVAEYNIVWALELHAFQTRRKIGLIKRGGAKSLQACVAAILLRFYELATVTCRQMGGDEAWSRQSYLLVLYMGL